MVLVNMLILTACNPINQKSERLELLLWKNQGGLVEEAAVKKILDDYNSSQKKYFVKSQSLPQGAYSQSVVAASLAGRMPCIIAVDSPMVAGFVWAGHIRPIEKFISAEIVSETNPSGLGQYQDHIYSVGQTDAALALYTRKSILKDANVRIPTIENPWNLEEFNSLLYKLKSSGKYNNPLDLGTRDGKSDWWTYAFSPFLQSFGGDLIDRQSLSTSENFLNGDKAIKFANWFQSLFQKEYVNRKEPDDVGFIKGRNALAFTGSWWAPDYRKAFGNDLLILPPPNFGNGAVIGGGSWQWAISKSCRQPEAAGEVINFLARPQNIAYLADQTGNIPVTDKSAQMSRDFRINGEGRVFYDLSKNLAMQRPITPAFSTVSNSFTFAMRDIMEGADVQDALDDAVDDINRSLKDNNYEQFNLTKEPKK